MTPTPEAIEAALGENTIRTLQAAARDALSASGRREMVYSPAVLKAIVAAYESAMEAVGFVRVPVEPTEAEVGVAADAIWDTLCPAIRKTIEDDTAYREAARVAMIAARPTTKG